MIYLLFPIPFIGKSKAQLAIDILPSMSGTSVTPSLSTSSCLQCIRGGWIWCSSKWHYSSETTVAYSSENGRCCFDAATANVERLDYLKANITNCPAAYSNASTAGSTATSQQSGSFWCSDFASSTDLALILNILQIFPNFAITK